MIGTTLYKRDSRNAVREWCAFITGSTINVQHGLVDGQLQTELTHCSPKNVGRSNETTAEQQALLECYALYSKKIDRDGYKVNLDEPDAFIAPMLSLDYSKVPHRVPQDELFLSPKLDGVRCLWVKGKGLQSRKGKFYKIPHLEELLKDVDVVLDGEIWIKDYPLNEIVSAVKKPNELTPHLQFHVFDIVHKSLYFYGRMNCYERVVKEINSPFIQAVPQACRNKSEIEESHLYYLSMSYEGTMIRVPNFPYEHTRSASLFKYKSFQEAEYSVTGVSEDKTGGGVLEFEGFKARCRGTDAYRRHQVEHPEEYIGKLATVRYFALTPFGIPQFPVVVAIRDYE